MREQTKDAVEFLKLTAYYRVDMYAVVMSLLATARSDERETLLLALAMYHGPIAVHVEATGRCKVVESTGVDAASN
jgi:hypothetical protein